MCDEIHSAVLVIKFELVVNLENAQVLGIKIPQPALVRANEAIH